MGNKSKQRTGDREGKSWQKIREAEPQKFIHGQPYRVVPKPAGAQAIILGSELDPNVPGIAKRQFALAMKLPVLHASRDSNGRGVTFTGGRATTDRHRVGGDGLKKRMRTIIRQLPPRDLKRSERRELQVYLPR